MAVEYSTGRASFEQIYAHLDRSDDAFIPPLSSRVDIAKYARKISEKAVLFEAMENDELIGLVAAYCSTQELGVVFVTNVSVLQEFHKKGIAQKLLTSCINYSKSLGFKTIELEVDFKSEAINFYKKCGFINSKQTKNLICKMVMDL